MAKLDPEILAHLEWIGFVRPTGLVVSAPALVRAGAILDRRDAEGQRLLRDCVLPRDFDRKEGPAPYLPDFRAFAQSVLGWSFSPKGYAGTAESPVPPELEVPLPDYGETLRPDFAVRELEPKDAASPWQLLVRVLETGEDFDRVVSGHGQLEASPHGRMERLLRQTGVAAGLLFNGRALRLLSAPRGESSGWLDFRVAEMVQTAGRPISTALRLLLGETRLLTQPRAQRLAALLEDSRRFQNEVSERLAEQVLHALYELLRGFQAAHDASKGKLLRQPLAEHPDEVYRALLTVILRLVFLLYAEERDMLPEDETFLRYYSLAGLYERLREDAALYPDTMDQRYGAWAQLLVLFRLIHDGAKSGALRLPKRRGTLFDPDRFRFLEGRALGDTRESHERIEPPLVPDGTIYRALEKMLVLDGERISYRALDVEQIGSVYQAMMGFRLEAATGRSMAIRAQKSWAAPTTIDLDALLAELPDKRKKWLDERSGRRFTDKVQNAVKAAATVDDLHAALSPVVDRGATPDLVPSGAMVLQPSEERRRSGSHYTPRAFTEPIVRTTLRPILQRLGEHPTPAQILDLKICDLAVGSAAFLVETCRQLGDQLVEAWHHHGEVPLIPSDEDDVLHARRLVAQRCLYGVDRNPMAVDLAKLSLWLATLARDHPFTFLDHAVRCGDSLVGLTRKQLADFDWRDEPRRVLGQELIEKRIRTATAYRKEILEADELVSADLKRQKLDLADEALTPVRRAGDCVIAAFFSAERDRDRQPRRTELLEAFTAPVSDLTAFNKVEAAIAELYGGGTPVRPLHWEIEFPEVFDRENGGFDAIVGNPPFQGGRNLTATQGEIYSKWLLTLHERSSGGADLVAHFFRRAFDVIRDGGAFGLIATNTIGQGDTRASGLRWICQHGGEIFAARKRVKWPGLAAVVVSVVHVTKGTFGGAKRLDDREVETITAFLFNRGDHDDPARLAANAGRSFQGSIVLGMGFTFDDTDAKGVATSLAEMGRLIENDPRSQEVIFPYIGGEEVNSNPTHAHHRYVINFGERSEEECRSRWPGLMAIVEAKVKPERITKDAEKYPRMVHEWWKFWNPRQELHAAIAGLARVLVVGRVGQQAAFTFLPSDMVFSEQLIVFPLCTHAAFCALQSRPHEIWARFFGSSMKDDLRYTPSDCFETFPFPAGWQTHPALEAAGKVYFEFRSALMVRNNEGLTKTYSRFHDPDERQPEILRLRELHAAMDRGVLDAYGWGDVLTECKFLLDYDIDEQEWGEKKKPWRYRWPDQVRDEVLARLLELNAERAKAEARSGATARKKPGRKVVPTRHRKGSEMEDLFS